MSVNKGDRRESKVEFDNTYFKVYDDCVRLIECSFGAKGDIKEKKQGYIRAMSDRILKSVCDMGTYIRIANSIYPQYQSELEERRIAQEKAIGLCFDVMTKYQLIMTELKVPDDKHTNEIKNLIHEINCLKKWRESDKRFKNLG
jgi:hypothetical protein